MKEIPDKSIDMILCDLPYGTTACKWDSIIPFDKLWEQYNRIIKDNSAIVLFGSEPFSSKLRVSNLEMYRYDWKWNKGQGSNFQLAKLQPLKVQEDICVFSKAKSANGAKMIAIYYPQKTLRDKPVRNGGGLRTCKLLNSNNMKQQYNVYYDKYPINVLNYPRVYGGEKVHPTQKPVALLEYLIKTYTNENELVLDNCMGSGSTGVACIHTNRDFIGFELDENYFNIAKERIEKEMETNESR